MRPWDPCDEGHAGETRSQSRRCYSSGLPSTTLRLPDVAAHEQAVRTRVHAVSR